MYQEARHRGATSANKSSPTTTIVETLEPYSYQNNSSSFCLPLTTMSNGRDRTSEFQTTVKLLASRRVSVK